MEPVHERIIDGTTSWWFWDETSSQRLGPFPSKHDAEVVYGLYCNELSQGKILAIVKFYTDTPDTLEQVHIQELIRNSHWEE